VVLSVAFGLLLGISLWAGDTGWNQVKRDSIRTQGIVLAILLHPPARRELARRVHGTVPGFSQTTGAEHGDLPLSRTRL